MRLRLFKGSGILNLLGMTAAFAALYILLVQVYYDLSYNKQMKDVERPICESCKHRTCPFQKEPCKGCRENPVRVFRGTKMRWEKGETHGISK